MIERVLIKELLSFEKIAVDFSKGLNVITGPSGAGKSVFINSLLANFGYGNQEAKLCEVELQKDTSLSSEVYDLDDDYLVIKAVKKDRVRFFINEQNISKKALKELFSGFVSYISVRDKSGFENEKLIELLDNYAKAKDAKYKELLAKYNTNYKEYVSSVNELKEIEQKVKESNERVEFLKYEIKKLQDINAKDGEYEELLVVKKQLSKLDKISEIAQSVEAIFEHEDSVYELFNMLEKDSSYLSDALNQLRADLEDIDSLKEELSEVDIEEVLNRLEELGGLIKRFGSIEEANSYLEQKREELNSFETIEADLSELKTNIDSLFKELNKSAKQIDNIRVEVAKEIETELEVYLKELKLPKVEFEFVKRELYELGLSEVTLSLSGSKIETLSGGEFNRVRLALLTVGAKQSGGRGVIILDEIDANVSGDESIAIANMISNLSKNFQVFAISHQAHLSSKANTHLLVTKKDGKSSVESLNKEQRVQEIARIVGGESFNNEALEFAKGLFEK